MADEFRIGQSKNLQARMGHLGGDSLVTEVEAQTIRGWFADDPNEEDGGVEKILVRADGGLAGIPKDGRAGAAFDGSLFCVDGSGGGATGDDSIHGQAGGDQVLAELLDRAEGSIDGGAQFGGVRFVEMTVVGMETRGAQMGSGMDCLVYSSGLGTRGDACAVHSRVQVQKDIENQIGVGADLVQFMDGSGVVDHGGEPGLWE